MVQLVHESYRLINCLQDLQNHSKCMAWSWNGQRCCVLFSFNLSLLSISRPLFSQSKIEIFNFSSKNVIKKMLSKKGNNERQVSKKYIGKKNIQCRINDPRLWNQLWSATFRGVFTACWVAHLHRLLTTLSFYVTRMKRLTSEKREVTFPKSLSFIAQTVTPVD